jgi:hypothetical protein
LSDACIHDEDCVRDFDEGDGDLLIASPGRLPHLTGAVATPKSGFCAQLPAKVNRR